MTSQRLRTECICKVLRNSIILGERLFDSQKQRDNFRDVRKRLLASIIYDRAETAFANGYFIPQPSKK